MQHHYKKGYDDKAGKLFWKGTDLEAVTEIRHGRQYTRLPNKSIRPTANIVFELLTGTRCRFLEFLDGDFSNYRIENLCPKGAKLDQEWARIMFDYRPFVGLIRKSTKQPAGYLDKHTGYMKYSLNGRTYGIHQLVWLYHNGSIPAELDHIDRDKQNNSIENLREADRVLQRANSVRHTKRSDLPKGVYFGKSGGYQVRVTFRGVCRSYGTFSNLDEAATCAEEVYKRINGGLGVANPN